MTATTAPPTQAALSATQRQALLRPISLPGPLTIPPVLVGLWIWSSEFQWAARFFATFTRKARDTWRHARRHPVSSATVRNFSGVALDASTRIRTLRSLSSGSM